MDSSNLGKTEVGGDGEAPRDARGGPHAWPEERATGLTEANAELKRQTAERKEAEERLYFQARLLDAVGQAVVATDLQGRIIYWNRAAEGLYGWSAEEVTGRRGRDFMLPEDQLERAEEIVSGLRAGGSWAGEFLMRRRDGTVFPALVYDTPVHDARGDQVGVIGVSTDITERKRAEEALRESEARHSAVVNSAFDAIVTMTADGKIESFNQEAEHVFGYEAEEVVGEPATLLMPERFREAHRAGLRRYTKGGAARIVGRRRMELAGRRKNGEEFPLELSLAEVREGEAPLFTAIMRDITERKRAEEQLKHQAFHDALTGLPNRHLFVDRLQQALARYSRHEGRVAVLFMDLDNFKIVNDNLGHEAGDRLLVAVARRLRACVRPEDTVARFGGDEFAFLLQDLTESRDVVRVAGRVTEKLREPFELAGREVFVAASIGIALGASSREPPEELLRNADTAMYRAKEQRGGTGYRVFDPKMHERALERLELENNLRRAIEREEFVVVYQPKVMLKTRRIYGFEALVRWRHPRRGLVSPEGFIPLAEETGLVVPIGRWVLREACRQAKQWQERYPQDPPLQVSVNLSPQQVLHPSLAEDVSEVLRETGLYPRCLALEVKEGVMAQDSSLGRASLQRLRDLGVQIEIDDFGIGYSSLSRLRYLPINTLKIDSSFVARLGRDDEDEHIVSSIINLAVGLGLGVVAEGVEAAEQAARLRGLGCEMAQGFFFSEPLLGASAAALLADEPDGG